jgi:hypothetical protein
LKGLLLVKMRTGVYIMRWVVAVRLAGRTLTLLMSVAVVVTTSSAAAGILAV